MVNLNVFIEACIFDDFDNLAMEGRIRTPREDAESECLKKRFIFVVSQRLFVPRTVSVTGLRGGSRGRREALGCLKAHQEVVIYSAQRIPRPQVGIVDIVWVVR